MSKNIKILTIATILSIAISTVIADSGWYPTRKSPFQTNRELETRATNQRDLITDCLERNINLSCHRAGVWLIKHHKYQEGIKYIDNACTLGRGYSCRVLGLYYMNSNIVDTNLTKAKGYFEQGCLRHDNKSCKLELNVPKPKPKPKPTGMDKLNKIGL